MSSESRSRYEKIRSGIEELDQGSSVIQACTVTFNKAWVGDRPFYLIIWETVTRGSHTKVAVILELSSLFIHSAIQNFVNSSPKQLQLDLCISTLL
jgi:hypothetical protein